jgi:TonB family protein
MWGRDHALGHDAADVMGNLIGADPVAAYGNDGLDLVGDGPGGGGRGDKTIGVGNGLPTIGRGGDCAGCKEYGHRAGTLAARAHKPIVPVADPDGKSIVLGQLSKDIIRRVVRQHLNEIKFCYDKELMKKSELGGRVMTQFTIAGNGKVAVAGIASSTIADPAVEQCMVGAIRRWEFPRPEGGGLVSVSYPFVMRAPQ